MNDKGRYRSLCLREYSTSMRAGTPTAYAFRRPHRTSSFKARMLGVLERIEPVDMMSQMRGEKFHSFRCRHRPSENCRLFDDSGYGRDAYRNEYPS